MSRLICVVFSGFFLLFANTGAWAGCVVTTNADAAVAPAGSLREAVSTCGSGGTITFSIADSTINLTAEIAISTNLTIDGGSQNITLNGGTTVRIFNITSGTVTLKNLNFENGYTGASANGGAIQIAGGAVVSVYDSIFKNNKAEWAGGAIFAHASSELNVYRSFFNDNRSSMSWGGRGGGAIAIYDSATASIESSLFQNNNTSGFGGAVSIEFHSSPSTMTIYNSIFVGNSAAYGGAAGLLDSNSISVMTIVNSTFYGNKASVKGNSISIGKKGNGSPLSSIGTLVLQNSILAGGAGSAGEECYINTSISPPANLDAASKNNLFGDDSATCDDNSTTLTKTDPNLGALQYNGGTLETMALLTGSPALDAGDNGTCITTDARGVSRPQNGTCDLGAYEYVPPSNSPPTLTSVPTLSTTEDHPGFTINFSALNIGSDANDSNDSVTAFVVKSVTNGTLTVTNDVINTSNSAVWTPDPDDSGIMEAFRVVARDSYLAESTPAVPVYIDVTPVIEAAAVVSGDTVTAVNTQTDPIYIYPATVDNTQITDFQITAITNGALRDGSGTLISNNAYITVAEGAVGIYFTPASDLNGTFTVTPAICDPACTVGSAYPATVTITVTNTSPVLTGFTAVVATIAEEATATLSFTNLTDQGDEADADSGDSVQGFMVDEVLSGTLEINGSTYPAGSAGINEVIDAANPAAWTPPADTAGTLNAFTVTAVDSYGAESGAPVAVPVEVTPVIDNAPVVSDVSTYIHTQTGPIYVSPDSVDGTQVTHYQITAITNGNLFQNDGTPISGNSFITRTEGALGLKFTPGGTDGSFTVQAATCDTSLSCLGASPVTSTVTVIKPVVNIAAGTGPAESTPPVAGTYSVYLNYPVPAALTAGLVVSSSLGGTAAINGDDYNLPVTVTIPAGQISADIPLTPVDDSFVDPGETVRLTLSAPAGSEYTLGSQTSAELTITDNDVPAATIALGSDAVENGAAGSFIVTLSETPSSDMLIGYTVSGSATAGAGGDYATLAGTVTVPGNTTSGPVSVSIPVTALDDSDLDPGETVTVTLYAGANYTVGAAASATMTITDNETLPVAGVAVGTAAIENGAAGEFTVSLDTLAPTGGITVNYTAAGTATAGSDYSVLSGTVTVAAGSSSATIPVTAPDDPDLDPGETVTVTLYAGADYSVGTAGSATMTIVDDEVPTATVALLTPAGETGPVDGIFTVTLSAVAQNNVTVNYGVTGTATPTPTNDYDYTSLGSSVTIVAGQQSADILVIPVDDTLADPGETVVVTLQAGAGYVVGTSNQVTVEIIDNDVPLVSIDSAANAAEAGLTAGSFALTIVPPAPPAGLTVSYSAGGTAIAGTDYTALSGTVSVTGGASTASISVAPLDDADIDPDETVTVSLLPGTDYQVGSPAVAEMLITDDEVPVATVTARGNATEGASGSGFDIQLSAPTQTDITLTYTTGGTATAGSDYPALSGSVTIAAGNSSAEIPFTVTNDNAAEGPESVIMILQAGSGYAVGSPGQAGLTIIDDDVPMASIVTGGNAAEEGLQAGSFTVNLNIAAPPSGLTVNYTTAGSAAAGSDYQSLSGYVVVLAGEKSAVISVMPIDDSDVDPAETLTLILTLNLDSGSRYQLDTPASATLTIIDNEVPTATVSVLSHAGEAGAVAGLFNVQLSSPAQTSLTIGYAITGTATSGSDYTTLSGSVTIPAGETSATVTLTPLDDTEADPGEEVILTLQTGTGYLAGTPAEAVMTITDNDSPGVTVDQSASTTIVTEGGSGDSYTVKLNTPPAADVVLTLIPDPELNLGAGAGIPVDLTFTPANWDTARTVSVSAVDDSVAEGLHSAQISHSAVSADTNYNGVSIAPVTATINDNDIPTVTLATAVHAHESDGTVGRVDVSLSAAAPAGGLTIAYGVTGSAGAGQDYQPLPGNVFVAAGSKNAGIDIIPLNDTLVDPGESVILTLQSGTGYNTGTPASTEVIIYSNDDTPAVSLTASGTPAEGGGEGTFTLSFNPPTPFAMSLSYSLTGSATPGADYQLWNGITLLSGSTVPVPKNTSTLSLRLVPVDDDLVDAGESVTLALVAGSGYTVAAPGSAGFTISDNDRSVTVKISGVTFPTIDNRKVPLVQGTAGAANAEVEKVSVYIRDETMNTWLLPSFPPVLAEGTSSWQFSDSSLVFEHGHSYRVYAQAYGTNGVVSNATGLSFDYFEGEQAFTTLFLELSSHAVLFNDDTLTLNGKLNRFPLMPGVDLSGVRLSINITRPDGTVAELAMTTTTDTGQFFIPTTALPALDQSGGYLFQAEFAGTPDLAPAWSEELTLLVGQSAGYALVVEGRVNNQEGLEAHNKTLNRIYRRLTERGFEDDNIVYLNYQGGQPGVDGFPALENIQNGLVDLQARMNSSPAPFYLIMVDHGGVEGSFYLDGNVPLSPEALAGMLDDFGAGLNPQALAQPQRVLIGACYSGNFVPALSQANRLVITSAAEDEVSYKGPLESDGIRSGELFMEELFHRLGDGISFKDAFEAAVEITEHATRGGGNSVLNRFQDQALQHPLLDDNGDGQGSNLLQSAGDGSLAANLFLGAQPPLATNFAGARAEILGATPTLFLAPGETQAVLTVAVNNAARVNSAPVDIRRPALVLPQTVQAVTGQQDIEGLLRIPTLQCSQATQSCGGTSDVFSESGMYELFYFVRDSLSGDISPLVRSIVYKNRLDNTPPNAFNLFSPANNPTLASCDSGTVECPQTTLVLDWQATSEPDGEAFTYTLLLATDSTFNDIVYRAELLDVSMHGIGGSAVINDGRSDGTTGLLDHTPYYWKVQAIDQYGEIRESPVWVFITDNPNAPPGLATAGVFSAFDGSALNDATVSITTDSGTPVVPDDLGHDFNQYAWTQPQGDYSLTVTAPGYTPVTTNYRLGDSGTGLQLGLTPLNTGTPGTVQFAGDSVSVAENSGSVTLTVQRSSGNRGAISVAYATTADTAAAGADFSAASGTLNWGDGDIRAKTVTITLLDDADYEGSETFTLSLGNPQGGASLGSPDTLRVTLTDDEAAQPGRLQFSQSVYQTSETAGQVSISVVRENGSDGAVSVNYTTADNTAQAPLDYSAAAGTLHWNDGDSAPKLFTVSIRNDERVEDSELIDLVLGGPGGDAVVGNLSRAAITITDAGRPDSGTNTGGTQNTGSSQSGGTVTRPDTGFTQGPAPTVSCPRVNTITMYCNAAGQVMDNITITNNGWVDNGILSGTVTNQGAVSNVILQPGSRLNGGIVDGYVAAVSATVENVHLAAGAYLTGGSLGGTVTGEGSAYLDSVQVLPGTRLYDVIINPNTVLPDDVILGRGVRFAELSLIPPGRLLQGVLPALGTVCSDALGLPGYDISAGVLAEGSGVLAAINTLPLLHDNSLQLRQTAGGMVYLDLDVRYAVQPAFLYRVDYDASQLPADGTLEFLPGGGVRFATADGLELLTHPALQAPCALDSYLQEQFGLSLRMQADGNLHIPVTDGVWFSARPAFYAETLPEAADAENLQLLPTGTVPNALTAKFRFADETGQWREQWLLPAPADFFAIYQQAENLVLGGDGLLSFDLDGRAYRGVLEFLVMQGTAGTGGRLRVQPLTEDVNQDGRTDFVLVYPDGARQILLGTD